MEFRSKINYLQNSLPKNLTERNSKNNEIFRLRLNRTKFKR